MIEGAMQIINRRAYLSKKLERLDAKYMRLVAKAARVADEINVVIKEIHWLDGGPYPEPEKIKMYEDTDAGIARRS